MAYSDRILVMQFYVYKSCVSGVQIMRANFFSFLGFFVKLPIHFKNFSFDLDVGVKLGDAVLLFSLY